MHMRVFTGCGQCFVVVISDTKEQFLAQHNNSNSANQHQHELHGHNQRPDAREATPLYPTEDKQGESALDQVYRQECAPRTLLTGSP